jgi:ElaA protein
MLTYSCLPFSTLTLEELYAVLAFRQEVFVVEQNCPYLDADGLDQAAWHLFGRDASGAILAYTRLMPVGVVHTEYCSIGRVLSAATARGTGLGRDVMRRSIAMCRHLFGDGPILIGAQSYLLRFYADLGFEPIGAEYLEDGIPHTKMILKYSAATT